MIDDSTVGFGCLGAFFFSCLCRLGGCKEQLVNTLVASSPCGCTQASSMLFVIPGHTGCSEAALIYQYLVL
jgi:hypothetical protein